MDRKQYKAEWYLRNKERLATKRKEQYTPHPRQVISHEERQKRRSTTLKLHNSKPYTKYRYQKSTAKKRGIVWEFIFETWWKVWSDSGKWEERGQAAHNYCMCRKGDTGPYSVDNVYIDTVSNNAKFARKKDKC
jgi:hypothetical protein